MEGPEFIVLTCIEHFMMARIPRKEGIVSAWVLGEPRLIL